MKLSDIKGEQALDALADIIDPITRILEDNEIALALRNRNNIFAVKKAIKKHKKDVIYILAILDGENPENYSPNILTIPIKLLEILNDPNMTVLFTSQSQNNTDTFSGSAMENTEDEGE